MPIWATIAYDILKTLISGIIGRFWQEHKQKEANDAVNKDMADTGAAIQQRLHERWTRD